MKTIKDLNNNAGVGLRADHIQDILVDETDGLWLEILADNWINGRLNEYYLNMISERYPITLHGVGLSLGSPNPLDIKYLTSIKKLQQRCAGVVYSEHLCFAQLSNERYAHDLLPVPYCDEVINHFIQRINQVQDFLGQQILLENVSTYLNYQTSTMGETEFLKYIVEGSGCGLLLDINNLYVNQVNLASNAEQTIKQLRPEWIKEIHLAGFEKHTDFVIDAHNNPVCNEVWELYQMALMYYGAKPTLIEWDNDIPSWQTLLAERNKAQNLLDQINNQNKRVVAC